MSAHRAPGPYRIDPRNAPGGKHIDTERPVDGRPEQKEAS